MRILLLALFAPSVAAAQAVTLDATGACPGDVTLAAAGLTPGGQAFLVGSAELGGFEVPVGPCTGTWMGIGSPSVVKKLRADADGMLSLSPTLGDGLCGTSVVVVDAGTCAVSAPASVQGETRNVTFRVDMSCSDEDFSTVHVTGPWAGADGWSDMHTLTDADGDGVWETTLAFAVGADVEYKFMVDSWAGQEDLVDDMVAGGDCAPITDFFGYANRLESAGTDLVLSDAYGLCGTCDDYVPPAGPVPVTFEVDLSCEGPEAASVSAVGPFNGWDFAANPLTDANGDGIWTGTYTFEAGTVLEYKYAINDWAGQEDLVDDMLAGADCAPVTDFASYANRLVSAEEGVLRDAYGQCGSCRNVVDFAVDLRCSELSPYAVGLPGPDVGWDFWARSLEDGNADGIWTASYAFDEGVVLEYTIALDEWAMQEDLIDDMVAGGECAPVTDFATYANRQVTVGAGVSYANTYDTCDACEL
ncbi:MAG: hypothetical protein ACI8PZ_000952 [Myxococcota bacterium]|jgi:hypothetical protein